MEIKLLHINWYLVLLTIMQIYVEASNHQEQMRGDNYFRSSMHKVLENPKYYKEILIKRRQADIQFFEILRQDVHYPTLQQLTNAISNIVKQITESKKLLEISKSISKSDTALTDQRVIDALLLVLEKTTFFVDIYYNYPEKTEQIFQSNRGWKILLSSSLSYTINFPYILDPTIIHNIVLLEKKLRLSLEDKIKKKIHPTIKKDLKRESTEF